MKEAQTTLREVPIEEVLDAQREEQEAKEEQQRLRNRTMLEHGLQPPADPFFDDTYT